MIRKRMIRLRNDGNSTIADFYAVGEEPQTFQMDIFNWTGSQVVADAAFQNFFSLSGIAKADGGNADLSISAGNLIFPAQASPSQVLFSTRINGTVGGASGTAREWMIQTRRPNGDIVGSESSVKVNGTSISNRDDVLASFTMNELDPFTLNGIQVGLSNESGQTITLTSVSVRVQRVISID
ncbi:protease [Salmonella enterica]|nr:protease [Salmonella enterica]